MKSVIVLGLMLIPLAAWPAAAQQFNAPDLEEDPVEMLLGLRRQLDLTRHQVTMLQEVQRELLEANKPLIQQVFEIQRQVRAGLGDASSGNPRRSPRPTESQMHAARAPMEAIRRNNFAAMERVSALLTEEQKRRAGVLLRIDDRRRDRPGPGRFPGNR